ncbi:MAG: hypothetical protein KatS3mg052_1428 [Candidatus Roseilinea sp.]|nr:MAG: hypothetical protein KatS3mg052_1428 [Candidatus Roseilinea sp.]
MNEQERIVQGARIEIQDRDGWHKTFVIQKAITHVGSEARNDIVLETWRGMGVSSRHVQIISMGAAYRVVNIGDREIVVAPDPNSAGTPIAPLATAELRDGALIQIGDFRLRLFMPPVQPPDAGSPLDGQEGAVTSAARDAAIYPALGPAPLPSTGRDIGLRLQLSEAALSPHRPLQGVLVVRNQGQQAGVQFRLEVIGLEPEMFEIGPGPILFPGAEKEVALRIVHTRKPHPPAGPLTWSVRATAPEAYPGQSATVTHTIQVLPFYYHSLILVEDLNIVRA